MRKNKAKTSKKNLDFFRDISYYGCGGDMIHFGGCIILRQKGI